MKTSNYYERFRSRQWETVKLFYGVCFYNHFMSFDYVLDICLAPLYRFVDNYVSILGPAFVLCCGSVMSAVIIISYWIGLPYWWNKNPLFTIFLLIVGNWLMVNAIFHFYMGIMCDPGRPEQMKEIKGAVSVCKKCIIPKPHRTHHCSVCNDCILLMDHHCPWLNNCVGHYNRRYFFLYMVYIVAGVLFLMIFGVEIFFKEIWLQDVVSSEIKLSGHSLFMHSTEKINSTLNSKLAEKKFRKRCIIFTALMCIGTFIALGLLMIRHVRLISRGETTIEMYINRSLSERCKKKRQAYINPYDFGKYKNWTLLLGIYNGSGRTWKHILFPSTHKPFGNGFEWPSINSNQMEWNHFLHQ